MALLDSGNHRVIVLDARLKPLFAFGTHGSDGNALGDLEYPFGISMDAQFIYVTDPENHRVQIFNHLGVPQAGLWQQRPREQRRPTSTSRSTSNRTARAT